LTDALTLQSAGLATGHVAITNACGAKSVNPKKLDYSFVKGKELAVAADADQPGIEGAQLHAAQAHKAGAKSVKIVTPPGFDISEDRGKDFRDWFAEGHTAEEYLALVNTTVPVTEEQVLEWMKGDRKAALVEITDGMETGSGEDRQFVPFPMAEIIQRIHEATGGWP
jgi:ABC-type sugar transport system substrate-binding protein